MLVNTLTTHSGGKVRALARIFFLLFFSALTLTAAPQIVNENLLMESATKKISEISAELYAKTGVSIILHAKSNLGSQNILEYEKNISLSIKSPYVLVVMADKEQKVDMIISPDLTGKIDKNNILNNYIIPIISANDKNEVQSRYSAALLNGISEIAEEIAKSNNVILTTALGNESKDTILIIKYIIYSLFGLLLAGLLYQRIKK